MVELDLQANPHLLSRRRFMQSAAALSAASALESIPLASEIAEAGRLCRRLEGKAKVEAEDGATEALKAIIKEKLGVLAIETQEAYDMLGVDIDVSSRQPLPLSLPRSWNEATLTLLFNTLSLLPEHLRSEYAGRKPHVALDHLHASGCGCAGAYYTDILFGLIKRPDVILVDADRFIPANNAEANRNSFRTIGHEFIHRWDIDINRREPQYTFGSVFRNDFETVSSTIRMNLGKLDLSKLTPNEALATNRLLYGFSEEHYDYTEALASIGELYLLGKNTFMDGLAFIMPRRVPGELYEVLRNEVFLGYEYPIEGNPKICR